MEFDDFFSNQYNLGDAHQDQVIRLKTDRLLGNIESNKPEGISFKQLRE